MLMGSGLLFAQEKQMTYNPNSMYPVTEEHKLYKMIVWRRIDYKEKINQPFFSTNNEITKIIMDAVQDGRLVPYNNDSMVHRMTKEDFFDKLKINNGSDQGSFSSTSGAAAGGAGWGDTGGGGAAGWGDAASGAGGQAAAPAQPQDQYQFPSQLTLMDMKEEVYFDDIRSRMYNNILGLAIIIPAEANPTGLDQTVGWFKYSDLEKLFRSEPDQAIWYNPQNIGQNRNMADAFLLRLFNGRVTKISNPRNNAIEDIYQDPSLALYMSQVLEYKMMEYEHDLWSY